jgi:ethanolamine utilization microcompartment shell protein EutS
MQTDVTVIMPVRDVERSVAGMVRSAVKIEALVERPPDRPGAGPLVFEHIALDERSGDNTLSVLSVLHGQIPSLRTLQDLVPGTAIKRAAAVARGDVWLVIDHVVDPELAAWGVSQVLRGQRAAIVPGEILVVGRHVGAEVLHRLSGGLVSAQNAVVRYLRARDVQPAWSPPPKRSPVARARLLVRGSLGRLGLPRFDRP